MKNFLIVALLIGLGMSCCVSKKMLNKPTDTNVIELGKDSLKVTLHYYRIGDPTKTELTRSFTMLFLPCTSDNGDCFDLSCCLTTKDNLVDSSIIKNISFRNVPAIKRKNRK